MNSLLEGFGSGAIAGATATANGPLGTIVYTLFGVGLFIMAAGIVIGLIYMAKGAAKKG